MKFRGPLQSLFLKAGFLFFLSTAAIQLIYSIDPVYQELQNNAVLPSNSDITQSINVNRTKNSNRSMNTSVDIPSSPLHFSIHLFAFPKIQNRDPLENFRILWDSIQNSRKIRATCTIFIHVQFNYTFQNNSANNINIQESGRLVMESFLSLNSKHGPVQLVWVTKPEFITEHKANLWLPISSSDFGIFLFEGTITSRHFLEYSEQIVRKYWFTKNERKWAKNRRCIGISLYNLKYDYIHNVYVQLFNYILTN
jgi:hypothetical protein